MHHLKCSDSSSCPTVKYTGESHRVLILNTDKGYAVGEEVCWDFIRLGQGTKISFTKFAEDMTTRYQTTNKSSAPFMCTKTFKKCVLTWICKQKIDFREYVDPFCGHDPKQLACDGTHLGVSAKQMKLDHAVTTPDSEEFLKPLHKRMDRLLLSDHRARKFLHYLSQKTLGAIPEDPMYAPGVGLQQEVTHLLQQVRSLQKPGVQAMVGKLMVRDIDMSVIKAACKILKMLCCAQKACLNSVFPFRYHTQLREVCQDFLAGGGDPS